MMDAFDFWSGGEAIEREIAPGMSKRLPRGMKKTEIALGLLSIGRNVCFKKDSAPAPAPDPAVAQAAAKNAQLGQDWLDFSKTQFAEGSKRQDATDLLVKGVMDNQLVQQDKDNAFRDKMAGYTDTQFALQADEQKRLKDYQDKMLAQGDDRFAQEKIQQEKANGYQDKLLNFQDQQFGLAKTAQEQQAEYQNKMLGYQGDQIGLQKRQQDSLDAYQAKQLDYQDKQWGIQDEQNGRARDQYNYYLKTFQPIEQQVAAEATGYDSPERQAQMAGEAKADVMDSAAQQRQTAGRQMASMGINPNSGRYAGITRGIDLGTALASAGAQNTTRQNVRDKGIMLRMDAANLGRGISSDSARTYGLGTASGALGVQAGAQGAPNPLGTGALALQAGAQNAPGNNNYAALGLQAGNMGAPNPLGYAASGYQASGMGAPNPSLPASFGMSGAGLGLQAGGASINAGNAALGSNAAGNAGWYQNNGIMGQGFNGAMQGYTNQGNILNTQYGQQLNAWQAQQQAGAASSAGIGGLLGTLGGAAITAF